jgi:hypothetical protein
MSFAPRISRFSIAVRLGVCSEPVFQKSFGALFGPVLFAALLAAGCGSTGTVHVTKVAVSRQTPSNLAFYLDVREDGRPVPGLQEKNFRVYEDGKLVPPKKGKRALLDADVVSANFAIIQIDLSGPIADSEYFSDLADTVAAFAADLNERQEVAVNVFDGNDEVAPFLAFGAGKEQFRKLAEGIKAFRPRNRNSNLYGAVYQGISALEEKLAATAVTEKQATLVVFTDRYEMSHTVGIEQMKEKLKGTPVQVYIIGVGEGINRPELTMLGKTGTFLSNDPKAFKKGFAEINQKLVSLADGRYVLSFCSTKRKGQHKLEIEVETPNGETKIAHKFNAAGFRNGCSPKTKPMFEEIEAMKADALAKQQELDAKEKEKEAAEAEAAAAAIKEPAGKSPAKSARKESPREMSRAAVKEPAKPAPAPSTAKAAAAKEPTPEPEPETDQGQGKGKEEPKAAPRSAKQAVDNE